MNNYIIGIDSYFPIKKSKEGIFFYRQGKIICSINKIWKIRIIKFLVKLFK